MKVVLVLDGDSACSVKRMFQKRGWNVQGVDTDSPADLVVFTGGADVSPSLYGEENTASFCDPARDAYEQMIYERALEAGKKMVGICRGGQFLNVMNGGKMIQHLGKRVSGIVMMEINVGGDVPLEEVPVQVDHHQGIVQRPEAINAGFIRLDDVEIAADYVVYYPNTKCLCFQPHPEWSHKGTEDLFFKLMNEYLGV